MASLYHIFLKPKDGVTEDAIKAKMDLALEWYKYADFNWVVCTTSDAEKWFTRLRPFADSGGSLLIMRLDSSDRKGWIAKSFWTWLQENEKK